MGANRGFVDFIFFAEEGGDFGDFGGGAPPCCWGEAVDDLEGLTGRVLDFVRSDVEGLEQDE